MHIGDEHQQPGQCLFGCHAKLSCLLDGVDGVAPSVGQPDDLRTGRLGFQQKRRKVSTGEGMAHRTCHLAAVGFNHGAGIFFQRMAKRIVGSQEKPLLATGLGHGLGRAIGHCVGVVGPVHGHVVAVFVGDCGGRSARDERNAVLLFGDFLHSQGNRCGHQFGSDVYLVFLEPLAGLVGSDVALVLVIGGHHFNLEAGLFSSDEVFNRHLGGHHGARA